MNFPDKIHVNITTDLPPQSLEQILTLTTLIIIILVLIIVLCMIINNMISKK